MVINHEDIIHIVCVYVRCAGAWDATTRHFNHAVAVVV